MSLLTRVDRYIGAELARGYAVVALVLLALFSLLAFLEELEQVGDGAYDLFDALVFVGMTTPSRVLRLLPFITLFGTTLGLWWLSRRSELVVLRAAGMSFSRFARSVAVPALAIAIATPLVYEFVAPVLYRDATLGRDVELGRSEDLMNAGFWSRRGDVLVEVGGLEHGRVPTDVRIYLLAPNAGIDEVLTAATADPDDLGNWHLRDAQRRTFSEEEVTIEQVSSEVWRPWWAEGLRMQAPPVESLSLSDLRGYIAYLEGTGQPVERWLLAYWRMWMLPVTALLAGLLAIPIALSGVRSSGFGPVALVVGGGLLFYLGDQITANAGLVAGLPPLMVAAISPAFLAVVLGVILRRLA